VLAVEEHQSPENVSALPKAFFYFRNKCKEVHIRTAVRSGLCGTLAMARLRRIAWYEGDDTRGRRGVVGCMEVVMLEGGGGAGSVVYRCRSRRHHDDYIFYRSASKEVDAFTTISFLSLGKKGDTGDSLNFGWYRSQFHKNVWYGGQLP